MTFDEFKKLDEYQREHFLNTNGIPIWVKHDRCRHSYAIINTPDKTYIASDRSSLLVYLELIYLLQYTDMQKLFEQEVQDYLQNFQGQIISRGNLCGIKYGVQSIMRKYHSNDYVKVISQGNRVEIYKSLIDCDIRMQN